MVALNTIADIDSWKVQKYIQGQLINTYIKINSFRIIYLQNVYICKYEYSYIVITVRLVCRIANANNTITHVTAFTNPLRYEIIHLYAKQTTAHDINVIENENLQSHRPGVCLQNYIPRASHIALASWRAQNVWLDRLDETCHVNWVICLDKV